jgi:HPt (histidine-containing phosphotransfer) domain-containing protein
VPEPLDRMFARQSREDLRRIREALRGDDRDAARRLAHGLAGAALLVGAASIARSARALERRLHGGGAPPGPEAATTLARAVERFASPRGA